MTNCTPHLRARYHTTWYWRWLGTAFGHFHLGSHNLMVTALGLVCEVAMLLNIKEQTQKQEQKSNIGKIEGPWPHYMILEVTRDGLWTLLSFGLSQSRGHVSWARVWCGHVAKSQRTNTKTRTKIKTSGRFNTVHASTSVPYKCAGWRESHLYLPGGKSMHSHTFTLACQPELVNFLSITLAQVGWGPRKVQCWWNVQLSLFIMVAITKTKPYIFFLFVFMGHIYPPPFGGFLGGALWVLITSTNDPGEPAVSYRWTGWVWEIPVQDQECRKITDHFKGIGRIYLDFKKGNWRMSTCSWLDLQTLGSQSVMPKILLNHWSNSSCKMLRIMLRNRCWPTIFHTITTWYAHIWCQKRFWV